MVVSTTSIPMIVVYAAVALVAAFLLFTGGYVFVGTRNAENTALGKLPKCRLVS